MTEITLETQRSPARSGAAMRSRQTGLNDALGWAIVVFVALVPIPFGSGRPFLWAVNAVLIGLAGIAYAAGLSHLHQPYRHGLGRLRLPAVLFILVGSYLAVQALPLGKLPFVEALAPYLAFVAPDGTTISPASISITPGATWLMLLRWASFGIFFFLVLQVAGSNRRRGFLLHAALAVITGYAVFGLASLLQLGDTILGVEKWAYQGSATATFVNRNSFATFLAFGATVSCALFTGTLVRQLPPPGEAPPRRRFDPMLLVYAVALAAIIPALLTTQSRMGTFSAVAGCLVVFLAALIRMPQLWLRALLLVPAALAIGAIAFYLYGQNLFERLGSAASSSDVRLALYQQVIGMISARPWIGYGGGSFELAYPLFHQLPVSPDLVWEKAHNSYLSLWAELGLVVGSIPIVLYLLMLLRILNSMGEARSSWAAKAAGLGALTVAALHSLVDFSLEIQADTIMLLFITGIAVAGTVRSAEAKR